MTLKTFKPYTKSTRGTILVSKSNLQREEIILAELLQEIMVVVINKDIEILIFIEVVLFQSK